MHKKKNMQHGPDWCLSITKDCFIFKDFFMGIIFSAGNWFNPKFAAQPFSGVINMSLKQMIEYIYIFKRRYICIYIHCMKPFLHVHGKLMRLYYIYLNQNIHVFRNLSQIFSDPFLHTYIHIYIMNVCVYTFI